MRHAEGGGVPIFAYIFACLFVPIPDTTKTDRERKLGTDTRKSDPEDRGPRYHYF